jgi:hypothetical protein
MPVLGFKHELQIAGGVLDFVAESHIIMPQRRKRVATMAIVKL